MFGSVKARVEFSFTKIWLGSALPRKLKPGKFRLGSARLSSFICFGSKLHCAHSCIHNIDIDDSIRMYIIGPYCSNLVLIVILKLKFVLN